MEKYHITVIDLHLILVSCFALWRLNNPKNGILARLSRFLFPSAKNINSLSQEFCLQAIQIAED